MTTKIDQIKGILETLISSNFDIETSRSKGDVRRIKKNYNVRCLLSDKNLKEYNAGLESAKEFELHVVADTEEYMETFDADLLKLDVKSKNETYKYKKQPIYPKDLITDDSEPSGAITEGETKDGRLDTILIEVGNPFNEDGTAEIVLDPDYTNTRVSFTVYVWHALNEAPLQIACFDESGSTLMQFYYHNTGWRYFYASSETGIDTPASSAVETWHKIVFTFDFTTFKINIEIDGVQAANSTNTPTIYDFPQYSGRTLTTLEKIRLGSANVTGREDTEGWIDIDLIIQFPQDFPNNLQIIDTTIISEKERKYKIIAEW